MTVTLPALSAHDPAASGEGSRDPLGLEAIAERLASHYLPAVTSRMSRIRALTILALAAHVCEPLQDEWTADETTPAWLVFEWIWAEAMARKTIEARGIPGIDTTRRRIHNGERLCHRNYLKGATALGLHGFYRTLAQDTRVLDRHGYLDEHGERLLHRWAVDQGLEGLTEGVGDGGKAVRHLRRAVERSLEVSACTAAPTGWATWFLQEHARPACDRAAGLEREQLRELLELDDRRAAVLEALRRPEVQAFEALPFDHLSAAASATDHVEVACALRAMVAFERFAAAVSTGFDLLRHASTTEKRRPVGLDRLAMPAHADIVRELAVLVEAGEHAFAELDREDASRDAAVAAFRGVSTVADLLDALIARHAATQKAKGGRGKRSWFESSPAGTSVRGPYTLPTPPVMNDAPVHPTRLLNAASFLRELS